MGQAPRPAGDPLVDLRGLHARIVVRVKPSMTPRLAIILLGSLASAQQFDVASIKPSLRPISERSYGNPQPGKYIAKSTPLRSFIEQAYGIKSPQILGGPDWVASDGYDLQARAEVPAAEAQHAKRSRETYMFETDSLRLQALLEDRFQLQVHRETRQLPVYALTLAKGGPKVQPPDCNAWDPDNSSTRPANSTPAKPNCGLAPYEQNRAFFKVTASGTSMTNLARSLSYLTDRPVLDQTGYMGTFNATLEWYDAGSKYATPADVPGPSLFTALHEQLGLNVKATTGPIAVLVIDRVARPSEN